MVNAIEVYRKEMLEIKKLLSEYRVLRLRHIYKLFYNKDADIIKKIIKYLVRNGQAYVDMDSSLIAINKEACTKDVDKKTLDAFDVMLKFVKKLTYQTKYEFPYQICFLTGEQQYQVIYVQPGDEQHINAVLKATDNEEVKYLVIVENLKQVEKLTIENVYRYCIVHDDGNVDGYAMEEASK